MIVTSNDFWMFSMLCHSFHWMVQFNICTHIATDGERELERERERVDHSLAPLSIALTIPIAFL